MKSRTFSGIILILVLTIGIGIGFGVGYFYPKPESQTAEVIAENYLRDATRNLNCDVWSNFTIVETRYFPENTSYLVFCKYSSNTGGGCEAVGGFTTQAITEHEAIISIQNNTVIAAVVDQQYILK